MSGVADGASNTMIFAEAIISTDSNRTRIRGGIAMTDNRSIWDTALDTDNGMRSRPMDWLHARGPGGLIRDGFARTGGNIVQSSGRRWSDGRNSPTGVWTILPPNSPTVNRNATGGDAENWTIVAASSNHPGGANTSTVDAQVRFISDSVDTSASPPPRKAGVTATGLSLHYGDLVAVNSNGDVQRYSGLSPWGVWGAYGSRNGGETVPMP